MGAVGGVLRPLMERAFALAETVEQQTELARRPSSIPAAAVHVARDLHGDLARSRALMIGAGEMGELLAQALIAAGLAQLVVTHPTSARAEAAAQTLNCHAGDFADLPRLLAAADIVLTSVNTRRFVLDRDLVRRAVAERRRKPIYIIDSRAWDMINEAAQEFEGRAQALRPNAGDAIESLRRESLRLAGGDAEKATRILVDRLMRLKRDS
jgi:glutamyl-tRNA reductase